MKKTELKSGDVVKIEKGLSSIISQNEGVNSLKTALESIADSLHVRRETLWKTIREIYPETEGWDLSLKVNEDETAEITILFKRD